MAAKSTARKPRAKRPVPVPEAKIPYTDADQSWLQKSGRELRELADAGNRKAAKELKRRASNRAFKAAQGKATK